MVRLCNRSPGQTVHDQLDFAASQDYRQKGYVILRALLPRSTIGTMIERTDGLLEGRYPARHIAVGSPGDGSSLPDDGMIRQLVMTRFPAPDPAFDACATHAELQRVAMILLGAMAARIFLLKVVVWEPGASIAVPWHQAEFSWRLDGHDCQGIRSWMPLLASSREGGELWVVPGSHRRGLLPHAKVANSRWHAITEPVDESSALLLKLAPGDICFHHRHLISCERATASVRRRINISQYYDEQPL